MAKLQASCINKERKIENDAEREREREGNGKMNERVCKIKDYVLSTCLDKERSK